MSPEPCLDCDRLLSYAEDHPSPRATWGQDGRWVWVCSPCYAKRTSRYAADLAAPLKAPR